jgi:hypothetical protein
LASHRGATSLGNLHAIPQSEYEGRCERLREMLTAARLDALVVTAEANLRYFAGFAPHLYVSPTRP